MNRAFSYLVLPVLVVLGVIAATSLYVVDVRQKALVLRFGEVVGVREEPGLYFKMPMIDSVVTYDARILSLPTEPMEVTPLDDRRLVVDAFARWQIVDVVRFRRAVGSGGLTQAQSRLQGILTNAIRGVLGSVPSTSVLSNDRGALMNQIRDAARSEAESLGVNVIDVRLTRTDLPQQNLEATYARMRAEREREAADEVARGGEAAQRVRATADRTVVELTSDARKQAEIIRGEADARRNAIYADAFGADPEFFAFTRSLTSYERALKSDTSTMVMSADDPFFRQMRAPGNFTMPAPAPIPALPAVATEGTAPEAGPEAAPADSAADPMPLPATEDMGGLDAPGAAEGAPPVTPPAN